METLDFLKTYLALSISQMIWIFRINWHFTGYTRLLTSILDSRVHWNHFPKMLYYFLENVELLSNWYIGCAWNIYMLTLHTKNITNFEVLVHKPHISEEWLRHSSQYLIAIYYTVHQADSPANYVLHIVKCHHFGAPKTKSFPHTKNDRTVHTQGIFEIEK